MCLFVSACSHPRPTLETEVASSVPAGTLALAGIRLDEVRGSDLARALPAAWISSLTLFQDAALAWIAYNGTDVLLIAAGQFAAPPPGAVLSSSRLALVGSNAMIQAAREQQAAHRSGAPELIAQAAPLAGRPIWAVIRGDAHLPVAGNLGNLNRILSFTQYATAAVQWDSGMRVEWNGYCATPDIARRLEESLRGLVTIAAAAARAPDLAALLKSVRIDRDSSAVHVRFLANASAVQELLR